MINKTISLDTAIPDGYDISSYFKNHFIKSDIKMEIIRASIIDELKELKIIE